MHCGPDVGDAEDQLHSSCLVFALEPAVAALFAYLWRGDPLSSSEVVGGVLILIATLLEPMVQITLPHWTRPLQA
jgi:hypothetical protein